MSQPEDLKKGLECCADKDMQWKNCEQCSYGCFGGCSNLLHEDALEYIQYLEEQIPHWISVKERLPEGEDPVLILVKETEHYGLNKEKRKVYFCQYLAYWDGDEWFTAWCNGCRKISDTAKEPYADDYEVTHWMPLPEPPKEG